MQQTRQKPDAAVPAGVSFSQLLGDDHAVRDQYPMYATELPVREARIVSATDTSASRGEAEMTTAPRKPKPDPRQVVIDPWAEVTAWDRTIFAAATVAAAAFWYFSQPLVHLADPTVIGPAGFFAGAGVAGAWIIAGLGRASAWKWVFATIATIGGAGIIFALFDASDTSHHLDETCRAIQVDMLRAQSARSDDPAVFQALGCRVQNVGQFQSRPTVTSAPSRH